MLTQAQEKEAVYTDTIVKLGQRRIATNLLKIGSKNVYYEIPDKPGERQEVARKNVQRIIHNTGRVEVLNKPVLQMVNDKQWQSVVVTEDEEVVTDMHKIDVLQTKSSSKVRNIKAARVDAKVRLQKMAVNKGANVLLIIKAEAKGGYGDMPYYEITAEAYSFLPPEAKLE